MLKTTSWFTAIIVGESRQPNSIPTIRNALLPKLLSDKIRASVVEKLTEVAM